MTQVPILCARTTTIMLLPSSTYLPAFPSLHLHISHFSSLPMASLTALPTELQEYILAHLSTQHLLSLSATCTLFHTLAQPLAYRNLQLTWRAVYTPPALPLRRGELDTSPLPSLRRKLDASPQLASLVRRISLPCRIKRVRITHLTAMQRALEHVLARCAKLEELELSSDFASNDAWFRRLMVEACERGDAWVQGVKNLGLTCYVPRERWVPGVVESDVESEVLCLLYAPNVRTIALQHLDQRDGTETTRRVRWPRDHAPCATHLTSLSIGRASASASIYKFLLACTPHLRVFELDCLLPPQHLPFQLNDLASALHLVHATLTRLEVRFEVFHDDEFCENVQDLVDVVSGSLGSLRAFAALTSLECSLHVLFGSDDTSQGVSPPLSAVLPLGLQELVVTDDLYMFSDFQGCFEDGDAMGVLERYFIGEQRDGQGMLKGEWSSSTPGLERFVYDLSERGELTNGYWSQKKRRRQLEEMCKEQGIKGEVVWEWVHE
jgi:hypothetical protein